MDESSASRGEALENIGELIEVSGGEDGIRDGERLSWVSRERGLRISGERGIGSRGLGAGSREQGSG